MTAGQAWALWAACFIGPAVPFALSDGRALWRLWRSRRPR